jgi:glycosyltransferase involved in cell wall biosynthesis
LLFPSWEEGFGWPIIEAQACGCRVLTSNRQPMMEVGGEGAVYADPEDLGALASAMGRLLDAPPANRQALVDCGLRNAARFSTEQMIYGYAELYRRLLG